MGRDKATIVHPVDGETLAVRTARLLSSVAAPVLEVGRGYSGLPRAPESLPGQGPLAAVASGHAQLRRLGWTGSVLVLATDLPNLTRELLDWLAAEPGHASVIPVVAGRPQPLCARYSERDTERAAQLVRSGRKAMADLLEAIAPGYRCEDSWPRGVTAAAFLDADTPDDLASGPGGTEATS